jgi:predicted ribonuclease YlaK
MTGALMLEVTEYFVSQEVVNELYDKNWTTIETNEAVNSYLVIRSKADPQSTAIVRHIGKGKVVRLSKHKELSRMGIVPKDVCQTAFLDSLIDPEVLINIAVGPAGTGKTTLALAFAAQRYLEEGKPIFMTKPTTTVGKGRAFGPVPGDIQEKYAPYLSSYKIVLKKLFSKNSDEYIDHMQERGHIQYVPVELARGCTYEDCTFIIDEVQNLEWHELNTIVSRMGEGTKLIVLGDPNQIDIRLNSRQIGLHKMLNSKTFANSKITSAIRLKNQYRSPICALIAEIDDELRDEQEEADKYRRDTSRSSNGG